ncbi:MAG: NADH-quinone oxidoreductase subunit D [Candidatus Riflebacteria bacterium]|nr:NADH-quinone oxidoreductase subunit D [Candidatus Riflebacteria bacterium]
MTRVRELRSQELFVNMGPQHPSTHGVLRLMLRTDGEIVSDVAPVIGYLHRCAEKYGESGTYQMVIPYTDRLDYLAGMNWNFGYCAAVEKLAGIVVPERAEYIRVIVSELNRIASHLIALGTYGLDLGAWTPFLYVMDEREKILDLFEMVCGARLTYSYFRIGGVSADLPEGWVARCREFLDFFRKRIDEFNDLLSYNYIFIKRTASVGVIPPHVAVDFGCTGPVLRGSGVKRDTRVDEPYSVYPRLRFQIPIGRGEKGTVGDCWDRYMVRIHEMEQCCNIVEQALAQMPEAGDVRAKVPKLFKPPKGEIYVRTESAKGELGFYLVSDGTDKPYRCKMRSPSYSNLSVLPAISEGMMLADLVATLGSLDVVMGEIDR